MDDEDDDPAVRAFARLEGRLAEVEQKLDLILASRVTQPDYSPALAAMSRQIGTIAKDGRATQRQIAALAETTDARLTESVRDRVTAQLEAVIRDLYGAIRQARAARMQQRRLWQVAAGVAVASILAMATMPGAVARSLPASWALPERMAARVLRTDFIGAAAHMYERALDGPHPDTGALATDAHGEGASRGGTRRAGSSR